MKKLVCKDLRWKATKSAVFDFIELSYGNETFGEFTFNFGVVHYLLNKDCFSFSAFHNRKVCGSLEWKQYYFDTDGVNRCNSNIFKKIKWDYRY